MWTKLIAHKTWPLSCHTKDKWAQVLNLQGNWKKRGKNINFPWAPNYKDKQVQVCPSTQRIYKQINYPQAQNDHGKPLKKHKGLL